MLSVFTSQITINGQTMMVWGRERPYLRQFLDYCSKFCELILFTASRREYADEILKTFDPEDKYFSYKLYRESCTFVNGNYIKDLNRLNRDLVAFPRSLHS